MTWPRAMPPVGAELTVPQALAVAHRVLADEGWQENLSGHVTVDRGDGTYWCTPWGRWWEEVRASDMMVVDADGAVLDGPWDVTPAVHLHTGIHRARPDATVVVHGHPEAATILACTGEPPVISHQNACIFDGALVTVDEYGGTVEDPGAGATLADRIGTATGVQLAHHGAVVIGPTIEAACYLAATYERMCRFTLAALQAGSPLVPLPVAGRRELQAELRANAPGAYWAGAARRVLRTDPDVLR